MLEQSDESCPPSRCNQRLRTGIDQSHVEQISPDKNMNCQCTTAAFTVSLKQTRGLCDLWLTRPREVGLVCDFCPSARTFAVRLPSHNPSGDCTCLKLVVIIGGLIRLQIRCWFTLREPSPHKFMPMLGVPRPSKGLRLGRNPLEGGVMPSIKYLAHRVKGSRSEF